MLTWLMIHAALATGVTHTEVTCPLDGEAIRQFHQVSTNKHGGYDSDLATYSSRGQFRTHAISTCPQDLLSLYGEDLGLEIPETVKAPLQAALARAREDLTEPDNPTVWERYGLAAVTYRALGRGPLDLAGVYLEASWTARDEAVGIYVGGLEGPRAAEVILQAGEGELAKDLTTESRKLVLYNLARVAHRTGYGVERDRYLSAFEATGSLDAAEHRAIERFRAMAHDVEPRYQRLAVAELRKALEILQIKDLPPAVTAKTQFLLADLLRRLGDNAEALHFYKLTAKQAEADPQLQDMAAFFIDKLGG